MKCEYCLAPITLEDKYCPHCGRTNHAAMQHVSDMAKYQREFSNTQKQVMDVTSKYKSITARIIILGILAAIMVVTIVLRVSCYSLYRTINTNKLLKNKQAHIEKMEEYLDNNDYLGFSTYCEVNEISGYRVFKDEENDFRWYSPVITSAANYSTLYLAIMRVYTNYDEYTNVKNICDSLNYFYAGIKRESNSLYGSLESYEVVFGPMEEQCRGLLVRYLDFTPEEADSLMEMSEAKRSVLMEEKIEAIKERRETDNEQ